MDDPSVDQETLRGNLRDLRRCNAVFGWRAAANRAVSRTLGATGGRVLDVATGSGDIPARLAAQHPGIECWVSDRAAGAVAVITNREGRLRVLQADARNLPFADGAFDAATLHLALHHFPPEEAVGVLAELGRVARRIVVTDLERSWLAYGVARTLPLVTRNPLTRHDGPVSVLRAYTRDELRDLGVRAGLQAVRVRRQFPARLTLTARGGR